MFVVIESPVEGGVVGAHIYGYEQKGLVMKSMTITKCVNQAAKSLASIDPKSAAIATLVTPVVLYGIDQLRSLATEVMDKHYKLSFKCPVVEMNLEPVDAA